MYQDSGYKMTHAQSVCTRPFSRGEGPGDKAKCEEYTYCTKCYSKVRAIDGICGDCMGCLTIVKMQKCSQKFVVKIEVEDDDGEVHIVTMFSNTLDKVVDTVVHKLL